MNQNNGITNTPQLKHVEIKVQTFIGLESNYLLSGLIQSPHQLQSILHYVNTILSLSNREFLFCNIILEIHQKSMPFLSTSSSSFFCNFFVFLCNAILLYSFRNIWIDCSLFLKLIQYQI